ncbi:MAG: tRNA-specific 2-thiouridylase [Verrucomicrobiales bacterium]|jgi:tRNA-specific 2-thiouridylase
MARILSAMSGGVDSSAATALLLEQGHDVVGAYMKNWINEDEIVGHCPWQQDIDDARAVSDTLGIEFRVVNLMRDYKERVVSYLLDGYRNGITPNPDVMCNREMKFGVFLDYALEENFEAVATGHYARTRSRADGSSDILCGMDPNKDQTYFLALMLQHQAAHARFPIGELLKPDVREVARRYKLPNAEKKDSQGICFIGEVKMVDFLRNYVDDIPGDIVNQEGKELGKHRGLHLYTLGQRRGLGVASNTYKEAYVVVEKRSATKELVVAFDRPDTPQLYASQCRVSNVTVINRPLTDVTTIEARPRYRTASVPITVSAIDDTTFDIEFAEPQRALTPGQICAFYEGEILLGGGVFEQIYPLEK